ncbi:ATP-dependent Clp protease adapter ClpS [Maribrevibacterium harenarium]|jgi:ATP-dependent Clp protease adaptor protein ClpS|uniref:ATP-dependent Clp protease adapter protein ClpS n=1 Tax=Maribrevibacterium harenarium TaxID=2589817 RepID=A0A501WQ09_9GAMM|nr:ATP-dependent Clp protease adapter ClpS [Maribrevibacterium harenarium]TPE49327.1 ATP-dependent Clp protease adapter ClpS [Maribrevibacterium harenarium]
MFASEQIRLNLEDDDDLGHSSVAIAPDETELKPPSMYQVVLFNDDFTPMDFVVYVLQRFFNMDAAKAQHVMMEVHTKGKGVCGVYTFDIAETKVVQVQQFAQQNEHPLMCDLEKAE